MRSQAARKPVIRCEECRHRSGVGFTDFDHSQLELVSGLKQSHEVAWAGETVITQNEPSRLVATLYSGLAIRARKLASGKRVLLSVLMPGDLFGLETLFTGTSSHSVSAVTDITYCLFSPERWRELHKSPSLSERMSHVQLCDQRYVENRFAAIAACTARESVAHFVIDIYDRLKRRRLVRDHSFTLPLTNRQFADALGLTTVHLHRVLSEFRRKELLTYEHHRIRILNLPALRDLSGSEEPSYEPRPFL